mmetsp:Transcript_2436/g.9881  ORF Transcript_2436/g.9881 Transcript_2436/m.9881 type:complete len:235 (+) Transcript_2436:1526-2230(+)
MRQQDVAREAVLGVCAGGATLGQAIRRGRAVPGARVGGQSPIDRRHQGDGPRGWKDPVPRVEGPDRSPVRLAPLLSRGDARDDREDAAHAPQQGIKLHRSRGSGARDGRRDERRQARGKRGARTAHPHDGHVPPRGALLDGRFQVELHRAARARDWSLAGAAGAREAAVREGQPHGRDPRLAHEPRGRRGHEGAGARHRWGTAVRRRSQHACGRREVPVQAVPSPRIPGPPSRR